MGRNLSNYKYIFFIISVYLFIFQNLIQNYIKIFQYFDELYSLFAIGYCLFYLKKSNFKIEKSSLSIFILLLMITITGIYQNLKLNYQDFRFWISDVLLFWKFFLTMFFSKMLYNSNFIKKYKYKIMINLKIIIGILFIFTIANYIFKLYPINGDDIRFGIMPNRIFYNHPTQLAGTCIFILALYYLCTNKMKDLYIYILLFIILSTLRTKAIGGTVISIILMLYNNKTNKKIKFSKIAISLILVGLIGFSQFDYYFTLDGSARKELLFTSFIIARDYLPLGTGFGTFATYISAQSYSPIYSMYNLNNVSGLKEGAASYVSDTFWPAVLGQFGYFGMILYAIVLIIIYKDIMKNYNKKFTNLYISQLICLIYLLISSTSESAFFHPMSIALATIIGISMNKNSKNKEKNEEVIKI